MLRLKVHRASGGSQSVCGRQGGRGVEAVRKKGSEKLPEAGLCPSAGLRDIRRFFSV